MLSVQVTELYIDEWSSSDPKVQAGFELFLTAADRAGIDLLVYVGEDAGPGVAAGVASVGRWCANATGRCGPRPTTLKTDDGDESAVGTGPSAAQVEEELESVIQEALVMYEKMDKLDVMGGEPGLRQRKAKPDRVAIHSQLLRNRAAVASDSSRLVNISPPGLKVWRRS